jgi:DUF4097 and DUF4098 domain-containing protein YvlB
MLTRRATLYALLWAIFLAAAPASADFRLERRLALGPGGTFTLQTETGGVTLTGDSPSGVLVTVTSSRDDLDRRFDFRFEESAGAVRVTATRRGSWLSSLFHGWFSNNVRFEVHVPRKTAIDVDTAGGGITVSSVTGAVDVHTSGGGLRIQDVEGKIEGRTSGGSIRIQGARGDVVADTSGGGIDIADVRGNVRAETSGGGIQLDGVTGDAFADTSGGGVRVRGAGGRVDAHSSGGSVTVAFANGNARGGVLSSSGGGVRTELDPAVALTIDASSSGGSVTSDIRVTTQGRMERNSIRGDLNGGGALLRVSSSGGGVRISASPSNK